MSFNSEKELAAINKQLSSSPTAYSNAVSPTSADVAADRKRMALEKSINSAEANRLKARWYGEPSGKTTASPEQESSGLFMRGLNALTAPAKAVVGAAGYARDKIKGETKGSFTETVSRNLGQGGETWGGFLQSVGTPHIAAAPIGFMMDVALDPLAIATLGTSSFVGKAAYGVKKAGLTGAKLAAKEQAARTGYNTLKLVPGFRMAKSLKGAQQIETGAFVKTLAKNNPMRIAWEKNAPVGAKMKAFAHGLGQTAIKTSKEFDATTGRNFMDILKKEAGSGPGGLKFKPSEKVEQYLTEKGLGDAVQKVKYSPQEWKLKVKAQDATDVAAREGVMVMEKTKSMDEIKQAEAVLEDLWNGKPLTNAPLESFDEVTTALDHVPPAAKPLVKGMSEVADDGASMLRGDKVNVAENATEWNNQFGKVAVDQAKAEEVKLSLEALRRSGIDPTGIKKFDEGINRLADSFKFVYKDKVVSVGEKTVKFLDLANKFFSMAKVALSPTAWVNGAIGNPVMAHLVGINVLHPGYASSMKGAFKMMKSGYDEKFLAKLNPYLESIEEMTEKMPTYSHQTLGIDLGDTKKIQNKMKEIQRKLSPMERIQQNLGAADAVRMAEKAGVKLSHEEVIAAMTEARLEASKMSKVKESVGPLEVKLLNLKKAKASPEAIKEAEKELAAARFRLDDVFVGKTEAEKEVQSGLKALKEEAKAPVTASMLKQMSKAEREAMGIKRTSDLPQDIITREVFSGTMLPLLKSLKKKAEGTGVLANASHWAHLAATKPGSWYSKIDSTYKLGTWHHLITNGLTEKEMRLISRVVPSLSEGVVETVGKGAQVRYMISPEAALDVVNEAYMQYAAMPAVVNMMRSLPIAGSPFVAFPYAMTTKVAKALSYNPAALNQVSFLMSDIGGRKTPSEKKALESPYYQRLAGPGFQRIPLFKDNPIYLNLTNQLPYLTLNQLMPSERHFESTWANGVSRAIDASPLFKNPIGQSIIDLLVIPAFLNGEEAPQGYFGQSIYPLDATGTEKVGYAARNLGEAFTPAIAGYAGLAAMVAPSMANRSFVEAMPSSKFRSMVYATQGKNSLGIPTREKPGTKTLRTMMSQAGINVTPVETEYSNK